MATAGCHNGLLRGGGIKIKTWLSSPFVFTSVTLFLLCSDASDSPAEVLEQPPPPQAVLTELLGG